MFSKITVKQLKVIARELKIKGSYKLKKRDLIEKITQIQKIQKNLEEEAEFEEEAWEDDWGEEEDSGESWDDVELTDFVLKKQHQEEKTLIVHEEIHCSNNICSAIYFNTIICPECNEINIDVFNRNLRSTKYREAKRLLSNLRDVMEDSLKSLYDVEINMFMAPIRLNTDIKDVCQCCFMEFDEDCGRVDLKCHRNFCEDCVRRWIMIKVRDNEVKPYIQCLSDKCHHPLPYEILNKLMDKGSKDKFIKYFSYKTLIKYQFFKQCKTYNCQEGVLFNPNTSKEHNSKTKHCNKCNETHEYIFKSNLISEEFKELIKKNIIRLCPSCSAPSTKDRQSCNVITCVNCSIYWNWETRVTGPSYESVYTNDSDHWNNDVMDDTKKDLYFEDNHYHGRTERVNDAFVVKGG